MQTVEVQKLKGVSGLETLPLRKKMFFSLYQFPIVFHVQSLPKIPAAYIERFLSYVSFRVECTLPIL